MQQDTYNVVWPGVDEKGRVALEDTSGLTRNTLLRVNETGEVVWVSGIYLNRVEIMRGVMTDVHGIHAGYTLTEHSTELLPGVDITQTLKPERKEDLFVLRLTYLVLGFAAGVAAHNMWRLLT